MSTHLAVNILIAAAAELTIAVSAGKFLRAARLRRDRAEREARAEAAAEIRATAVSDAIEAGDQEALLIACGLIPDPSLADLPAGDAAELQAVIYPVDIITAGGAR